MTRMAILAAWCSLGLLAGPAAAQDDRAATPQPTRPGLGGRQFPSGEVERQLRPPSDSAAAERDRRQLKELNDLSRQLTPPGTPVPAPEAEQANRRR